MDECKPLARGLGGAMLGGLAGVGALKSVGVADVRPCQSSNNALHVIQHIYLLS